MTGPMVSELRLMVLYIEGCLWRGSMREWERWCGLMGESIMASLGGTGRRERECLSGRMEKSIADNL